MKEREKKRKKEKKKKKTNMSIHSYQTWFEH